MIFFHQKCLPVRKEFHPLNYGHAMGSVIEKNNLPWIFASLVEAFPFTTSVDCGLYISGKTLFGSIIVPLKLPANNGRDDNTHL